MKAVNRVDVVNWKETVGNPTVTNVPVSGGITWYAQTHVDRGNIQSGIVLVHIRQYLFRKLPSMGNLANIRGIGYMLALASSDSLPAVTARYLELGTVDADSPVSTVPFMILV